MKKIKESWLFIVIVFVIFWPVGLYLVVKKVLGEINGPDKKIVLPETTKSITTSGSVIFILGISSIGVINSNTENILYAIISSFVFISTGAVLILTSYLIKKIKKRLLKYTDLIENNGMTDIDNIASSVGVSYEVVVNDLQKFYDAGILNGYSVDENTRKLVKENSISYENNEYGKYKEGECLSIRCKSCGANVIVKPTVNSECEYCGNVITV